MLSSKRRNCAVRWRVGMMKENVVTSFYGVKGLRLELVIFKRGPAGNGVYIRERQMK